MLSCFYLESCPNVVALPETIGGLNLQNVSFKQCSSLAALPETICDLEHLRELDLSECSSLVALPSDFGYLFSLKMLDLSGCSSLTRLPSSFDKYLLGNGALLAPCRRWIGKCNYSRP